MDAYRRSPSASTQGSADTDYRRSPASRDASPQGWPAASSSAGRSASSTTAPPSEETSMGRTPTFVPGQPASSSDAWRGRPINGRGPAEPGAGAFRDGGAAAARGGSPGPQARMGWKVVTPAGLNVRSKPDKTAPILGSHRHGDVVYGTLVRDWIELDTGGFMLTQTPYKVLLQPLQVEESPWKVSGRGGVLGGGRSRDRRGGGVHEAPESFDLPRAPAKSKKKGKVVGKVVELDPEPLLKSKQGSNFVWGVLQEVLVGHPGCWALCWLLVFMGVAAAGVILYPPEVETDFSSFLQTDVESSLQREAFELALNNRVSSGRRLAVSAPMFSLFDVYIAYELREDGDRVADDLFSYTALSDVSRLERGLRGLFGWDTLCSSAWVDPEENARILCNPGVSLAGYALPSGLDVTHRAGYPDDLGLETLSPNSGGGEMMPMEGVLRLLEKNGLNEFIFPVDYNISDWARTPPQRIRSVFRFKIFCCYANESVSVRRTITTKHREDWEEFVKDTLLPYFQEANDDDMQRSVIAYYDGTDFQSCEVLQVLFGDLRLAAFSAAFLVLYMLFHTRSILLATIAIILIFLSIPLAYAVFILFKQLDTSMSIASFMAFFVIVGLGADNVFVYTDFWRCSAQHSDKHWQRLCWTYKHAGMATMATSVTTAVSFFANLASVIRPLREFGLFMGLCIMFVWALVSIIYVPLCLENERLCPAIGKDSKCCGGPKWGQYVLGLNVLPVKLFFFLIPTGLAGVFCYYAYSQYELDQESANIFPEDHNQNYGRIVFDSFEPTRNFFTVNFDPIPPMDETVCNALADYGVANPDSNCGLFFCEATLALVDAGDPFADTTCIRDETSTECGFRIVGLTASQLEQADSDVRAALGLSNDTVLNLQATALPTILLEEWTEGLLLSADITEISVPTDVTECQHHYLCFRKNFECQPKEWTAVVMQDLLARRLDAGPAPVGETGRRMVWPLPPRPRRLTSNDRAIVDVAFGLEVGSEMSLLGTSDPSWGFHSNFDVARPWAQRDMYQFCTTLPSELRVVKAESFCWIEAFKTFVEESKNDRFPVPASRVSSYLDDFMERTSYDGKQNKEFFWFVNGEVRACYMFFRLEIPADANTEEALDLQEKWDRHLQAFNADASRYTKGAFHTSQTWSSAQAQDALVSSTFLTLSIILAVSFLAVLCFTRNLFLSVVVAFCVMSVVFGLAFFIVIVLDWAIGPVEVISLIVFIGYALDYSLHVSHKYCSREALLDTWITDPELKAALEKKGTSRLRRVGFALHTVGFAALGSAITTVGCTVFLLFCTLTIFTEIGTQVLVITFLSLFVALVPLPAFLLILGPAHPQDNCSCALAILGALCGRPIKRSDYARDEYDNGKSKLGNALPPLDQLKASSGFEGNDLYKELTAGLQGRQPVWKANVLEANKMRFRAGAGDWAHLATSQKM